MSRVPQTKTELEKHLGEQLHFLRVSADAYDAGYEAEAKRMAVVLRVLLHDGEGNSNSKSLLGLLGLKEGIKFYDSAVFKGDAVNVGASLVVLPGSSKDGKAIPFFDDSPPETIGYTPFEEYWNKPILTAGNRNFTRRELVKFVADQDGGAHVDAALNEEYAKLSRENSFGWKVGQSDTEMKPVSIIELASLRQIAHEILRTLIPDYPRKDLPKDIGALMYPRIFFERVSKDEPTDPPRST